MGKAILFSAPSGCGKTTIIRELMQYFDCFGFSISATSRQPREGEQDGRDYYYLSRDEFMRRVAENFKIGEKGERNCRMYFRGRWVDLSWSVPPGADAVASLDVAYLQENLLAPVLGIGDPRTDPCISFMGGVRGDDALAAKVDSGENAVAFAMNPVTVEEIMAIADAGAIMPPKSTWFEPKLRSGLFVHAI